MYSTPSCIQEDAKGTTAQRRRRVYDLWDAYCERQDDLGREIDHDKAVDHVAYAGGFKPSTVATWLGNPRKYSPWIDLVAVERAAALDWDVLDTLSRAEMRYLGALLVARRFEPPTGRTWPSKLTTLWFEGTLPQRTRISQAMSKARSEA